MMRLFFSCFFPPAGGADGTMKGVGKFCIDWAYAQCGHLRMDTHGDNTVMQNLLKKCGFAHCGTIYVEEDDYPRDLKSPRNLTGSKDFHLFSGSS